MIELILALGVVAVGVVSITALFPVGLGASRDGMAEMSAAMSADQMLHYLQFRLRDPTTGQAEWTSRVYDYSDPDNPVQGSIPGSRPVDSDDPNLVCDMTVSGAGESGSGGTLFEQADGIYQLVRFREGTTGGSDLADEFNPPSAGDDQTDFRAIAVLWQEDSGLLDTTTDVEHRDIGVTLKVEVSWPAEIPYARRQKAVYQLELFKR
ncbi:MAG: hypothetical protein HN742_06425 [Lentisphaerae bacterium]|nr:hypothetical protein [Lentisphaerota bacterium]MBT4819958.1 hypothetical protein [Lentisphaerota bacterium]MBT5610042.1 hypothetical protein [Lentisphaerota bacterium]MBT7055558.1 hypothetical protein [Lentisphaerota bacterium]MBT7841487.1 hypothetical protein [Lentisphaerota bacterium]